MLSNALKYGFVMTLTACLLGGCALLKTHKEALPEKSSVIENSQESVLRTDLDTTRRSMPLPIGYGKTLADSIIDYARLFMRAPYKPGGNGPDRFDCSGYTKFVFNRFGYELKRTAKGQLEDGWRKIDDTADLQRGDLVFYGSRKDAKMMGHVGIVVDANLDDGSFTFIHATVKLGVIVSNSMEKYYRERYIAACRVLPDF